MKAPLARRFVSDEDAVQMPAQHRKPCADCPFARTAIPGWLGSGDIDSWIQTAHGEASELCHCTKNQQCAGLAIFRANVFKRPRLALTLPRNQVLVFASDAEFRNHHSRHLSL